MDYIDNMAKKLKKDNLELSSIPNKKYEQFFDKFKEIETLDIKLWNSKTHILALFCKKYKETYGMDYQFKFNDPNPSKCYEVWRVSTLVSRLSKDPEILKGYIDWVWEEKVSKAKKRFSSISYITNDNEVNQYKMNVLFANNKTESSLDRSSPLPEKFKNIFHDNGFQMNSYGDLAFYWQSNKSNQMADFNNVFAKVKEAGFDESILEKIK